MQAARGEAEHDVAGAMSVRGSSCVALGGADREAREVVVAVGIHAGHLGRLAADQRAAGAAAALGDAGDDAPAGLDLELAGREVVEEEQRLGALHDDVVDAHRDQVDADRVGDAGLDRDLELGADAVGAGDQDRVLEAGRLEVEQAAEAAQPAHHAAPVGAPGERLDVLDQGVAGIDVDARFLVGQGRLVVAGVPSGASGFKPGSFVLERGRDHSQVPDSRNAVSPHVFHDPRHCAGAAFAGAAQAQIASSGNTYTIGGIDVDVTGRRRHAGARRRAIREAQQKAIKLLVERMVPAEDRAKVPPVDDARLDGLVRGIEFAARAHRGQPLHRHPERGVQRRAGEGSG